MKEVMKKRVLKLDLSREARCGACMRIVCNCN